MSIFCVVRITMSGAHPRMPNFDELAPDELVYGDIPLHSVWLANCVPRHESCKVPLKKKLAARAPAVLERADVQLLALLAQLIA